MKTIMKFFVLLTLFATMACGSNTTDNAQSDQTENTEQTTDSEQQESHNEIVDAYLAIKDAFVASDVDKASANAKKLNSLISDSDLANADKIKNTTSNIASANNIENQREQFEQLSIAFYDLAKKENLDITLYKQFCPMAFDNKGAYWLSMEKEIRNPYFGDKMLKCGKVQEEL